MPILSVVSLLLFFLFSSLFQKKRSDHIAGLYEALPLARRHVVLSSPAHITSSSSTSLTLARICIWSAPQGPTEIYQRISLCLCKPQRQSRCKCLLWALAAYMPLQGPSKLCESFASIRLELSLFLPYGKPDAR